MKCGSGCVNIHSRLKYYQVRAAFTSPITGSKWTLLFLFATKGGIREMAVFRVEKNSGYTVMSNHHLRNRNLSLKAKGLLSQMLSLPEDWDYTLQGLARINRESIDAIRQAIRELEQAGYIQRSRERDEKGRLRGADYVIFELPQPIPASVSPTLENPTLENPTQENPTLENPMQLNKDKLITEKQKKERLNTDSIPIHSPNPLPLDEDEAAAPPPERTGSRKEAAYQIYRDLILENIEYDTLIPKSPDRPGAAGRDRGHSAGNRLHQPQVHPGGRGRLPGRAGQGQVPETGQPSHRVRYGLPAGQHHQSPQHQAIPAGHAVQRPQHHQQLLCVPCGARYGAARLGPPAQHLTERSVYP